MGIYTFGKTRFNSHYPKINGIQWDYFNGNQWENWSREWMSDVFFFFLEPRPRNRIIDVAAKRSKRKRTNEPRFTITWLVIFLPKQRNKPRAIAVPTNPWPNVTRAWRPMNSRSSGTSKLAKWRRLRRVIFASSRNTLNDL